MLYKKTWPQGHITFFWLVDKIGPQIVWQCDFFTNGQWKWHWHRVNYQSFQGLTESCKLEFLVITGCRLQFEEFSTCSNQT